MSVVSVNSIEFLPYLGFWNRMIRSDMFVLADTMRFRPRDYQNRNRVRTEDGWSWFTIPVIKEFVPIRDIRVKSVHDLDRSWAVVEANYRGRAEYWEDYAPYIKANLKNVKLFDINIRLINYLRTVLNIKTEILMSSAITDMVSEDFLSLSINVSNRLGADTLLSSIGNIGTLSKLTDGMGPKPQFQEFLSLPYPQIFPGFHPRMSVLDCLLTHGAEYTRGIVEMGWSPQEVY